MSWGGGGTGHLGVVRGRVVGGRVRGGLVLGVDGLALVLDVGDVAVVMVGGVGDGLEAAVGEVHLRRIQDNYTLGQKAVLLLVSIVFLSLLIQVLIYPTGSATSLQKPMVSLPYPPSLGMGKEISASPEHEGGKNDQEIAFSSVF